MKHAYRWHRRLGTLLAPLLAVSALSGAALLWLQPLPTHADEPAPIAQWALALDAGVNALHRSQPRARVDLVDLPRTAAEPLRVHLAVPARPGASGWVDLDAASGQPGPLQRDDRDPRAWLLHLHEHLLQADIGPWLLRAAAIAAIVTVAMGLRIWWRVRRLAPRSAWRRWHRWVGAVACVPLLALLASGFVLRSPAWAQAALSSPGTTAAEAPRAVPPRALQAIEATLGQALAAAAAALPDARPMRIYAAKDGVVRVRLRSDEWHPNGLDNVYLHAADATLVRAVRWRELPLAARYLNLVYPLHTGWLPREAGVAAGLAWRGLWTAVALSMVWLALSGSVQRWRAAR